MDKRNDNGLPRIVLAFFRWFCHPDYREDIEGDLRERFEARKSSISYSNARLLFVKDVMLLFRPGIIRNFHHHFSHNVFSMQRNDWIKLIVTGLCLTLIIMLPFLPGPSIPAVVYMSTIAQVIGFFGLVFVPLGLAWMIAEIRMTRDKDTVIGDIKLSFVLAILTTLLFAIVIVFIGTVLFIEISIPAGLLFSLLMIPASVWTVKQLKKIRRPTTTKFNRTPVYLMIIPLIACAGRFFVAAPFSDNSRAIGIERGQSVISAIEAYRDGQGFYPDSLSQLVPEYLTSIPKPGAIGIKGFDYERTPGSYNLTFIQWVEMGTAQEIVRYNKEGRYDIKGAFASFDTKHDHWRYYRLD